MLKTFILFLGVSVVSSSVFGLIGSELNWHRDWLVIIYSAGVLLASVALGFRFNKVKTWSLMGLILGLLTPVLYLLVPMYISVGSLSFQTVAWTGVLATLIGSILEELGWREFLYRKYLDLGLLKMSAAVGLMWSMWHWPAILTGAYTFSGNMYLGLLLFTINLIFMSYLFALLRQKTGSVIAPIMAHFSHNLIFDLVVTESNIAEYRLSLSVSLAVLMLLFYFVSVYFVGQNKGSVNNHGTKTSS